MRYLAVAVSLVMFFPTMALPGFFKWTDSSGAEHFTDDITRVPAQYRKKAIPLRQYDGDSKAPPSAGGPVKGIGEAPATRGPGETLSDTSGGAGRTGGSAKGRQRRALQDDGSRAAALARTLLKDGQTEREKAYAVFSWIRAHITYDNSTKWQRRYGNHGADQSPDAVLASGRGVCEGLANLFTSVAERMGLESVVIAGRASGARQERHVWNAVKVDGQWGLVDITRHTFLATPQEFLARHFPDDPKWQLLDNPLTYEEWLKR